MFWDSQLRITAAIRARAEETQKRTNSHAQAFRTHVVVEVSTTNPILLESLVVVEVPTTDCHGLSSCAVCRHHGTTREEG